MAVENVVKILRGLDDNDAVLAICREVAGSQPECCAAFERALLRHTPKKKKKRKKKKQDRPFDITRWATRDIALWLSYEGDSYCGLADQVDGIETIEKQLFSALDKCRLIESRDSCRYSRCGRTDRGVSAQCQVVGLRVRSALPRDETPPRVHPGDAMELNYCDMLNRVLPPDVRAVAWCPVAEGFSARFSAASRTYRYFFPRCDHGRPYDVERMRIAAAKLVGEHDFRNLCKMDVEHVKNYRRLVLSTRVVDYGDGFYFEICGQAFLWHMVRCVAAVLFLVGLRLEEPDVIDALLDVETNVRRPQYKPAPETPLVLQDCAFDTLRPTPTPDALLRLTDHAEQRLDEALVLAARRRNALDTLLALRVRQKDVRAFLERSASSESVPMSPTDEDDTVAWADALETLRADRQPKHRPLLHREGGKTYDERVDALGPRKRERLEANERKRQDSKAIDQAFHTEKRHFG